MKRFFLALALVAASISAFAASPVKVFEELFDGRFLENDKVEQTIIKQKDNYYRTICIADSPELIRQISQLMQKEAANGANFTDYQNKETHYFSINYENNGYVITVYFRHDNDKDGQFFIQGNPKAFE